MTLGMTSLPPPFKRHLDKGAAPRVQRSSLLWEHSGAKLRTSAHAMIWSQSTARPFRGQSLCSEQMCCFFLRIFQPINKHFNIQTHAKHIFWCRIAFHAPFVQFSPQILIRTGQFASDWRGRGKDSSGDRESDIVPDHLQRHDQCKLLKIHVQRRLKQCWHWSASRKVWQHKRKSPEFQDLMKESFIRIYLSFVDTFWRVRPAATSWHWLRCTVSDGRRPFKQSGNSAWGWRRLWSSLRSSTTTWSERSEGPHRLILQQTIKVTLVRSPQFIHLCTLEM